MRRRKNVAPTNFVDLIDYVDKSLQPYLSYSSIFTKLRSLLAERVSALCIFELPFSRMWWKQPNQKTKEENYTLEESFPSFICAFHIFGIVVITQ